MSARQQAARVAARNGREGFLGFVDSWQCCSRIREFREQLVFKGGTSLSKVFGVIDRFSEDIDLSVSPAFLGISEEEVEAADNKRDLTKEDADRIVRRLDKYGVPSTVLEHAIPDAPDAVFIGGYVRASDARFVLSLLPYEVKYLFRPDYPESEGGDSTGRKIGVGYISSYNPDNRSKRSEPVRVTTSQFTELKNPRNTDTEFQCLLHRFTKSYEIS